MPPKESDLVQGLFKKVKFLTAELEETQKMNKKLTELLETNQTAVQAMTHSQRNPTSAKTSDSVQSNVAYYMNAMASLNQENRILLDILKDLMKERSIAQCKGLVLEQIMDMTESEYRSVVSMLSKELKSCKVERGNQSGVSGSSPRTSLPMYAVPSNENRAYSNQVILDSSRCLPNLNSRTAPLTW